MTRSEGRPVTWLQPGYMQARCLRDASKSLERTWGASVLRRFMVAFQTQQSTLKESGTCDGENAVTICAYNKNDADLWGLPLRMLPLTWLRRRLRIGKRGEVGGSSVCLGVWVITSRTSGGAEFRGDRYYRGRGQGISPAQRIQCVAVRLDLVHGLAQMDAHVRTRYLLCNSRK